MKKQTTTTSISEREELTQLLLATFPQLKQALAAQHAQLGADTPTLGQIQMLGQLLGQPITLGTLAERCRITRQGASLQVQQLVERGWVRRIPDPNDRRSALLAATDEGRTHCIASRSALLSAFAQRLAPLAPEEAAALRLALYALQRIFALPDEA